MKKKILSLSLALAALALTACGPSPVNSSVLSSLASSASASSSQVISSQASSSQVSSAVSSNAASSSISSSAGEREVKTYVDWDFKALNVGDEIPSTASEGSGFAVSRKDEDGTTWVATKDHKSWGAMYFGTPGADGNEVYLKDFCISAKMYLPEVNDGLSNDGGFPLFVSAQGRYDAAIAVSETASVNVWIAGNTDNGPIATTQKNDAWGDRGSLVDRFVTYPGVVYNYTVCGKYLGANEDGDEFIQLYAFIDDRLLMSQKVAYWAGGFGLRGWQSAIEYTDLKVTDFPKVCPDGINHYEVEDKTTFEPTDLVKPTTFALSEKHLTWDAVEHARGYRIMANGKKLADVTTNSYDLAISDAGTYTLGVIALGDGTHFVNSSLSDTLSYTVKGAYVQKVYMNWDFAGETDGADMQYVGQDGAGFKVVTKDGKNYVTSKDPTVWAAAFFGVAENGTEVKINDFEMSADVYIPADGAGSDGGFCINVGADRYDVALYVDATQANCAVNVYKSSDTSHGPVATTQKNPAWGDRGSLVDALPDLSVDKTVNLKVISKAAEDGKTVTLWVFIDNVAVIAKAGLPLMQGGFGVRGWKSKLMYTNLTVKGLPETLPATPSQYSYLSWDFAGETDGADMQYVGQDGAGFKVVAKDGKNYVTSKDPTVWAGAFFGIGYGGGEGKINDFEMSADVYIPADAAGSDGGFCINVGSDRYDVALYVDATPANCAINVWKASGNPNGPVATTQHNDTWGDRGSLVETMSAISVDKTVNLKVICKASADYTTETLCIYLDNVCVIAKTGIALMTGGYGVRASNSKLMYTNIQVKGLPLSMPDGIARW